MTEYNKISQGRFTGTAATAKFVELPYLPLSFEMWNKTEWGSANAAQQVQYAVGFQEDANGTAYSTVNTSGAATLENSLLTSNGFTFITADTPQFGAVVTGSGATAVDRANPTEINITSHGFATGDVVWVYNTTGMLQIGGIPYTITRTSANQFTIPVDSSGFAANGTAVSAKELLYPDLYIPFLTYITAITTGTTTTITTSMDHGFVVGQQVQFVIPDEWGMVELDGLTGYISSVTATQFVVNINSTGFTAFAYPTSAVAGAGITFPHVVAIGDSNFGSTGAPPFTHPINIPGAFYANTRTGVLIGPDLITNVSGGGADIRWRAEFPDQYVDET